LTNGLGVVEVVHTKIVVKVQFRVTAGTEVFVVGADVSVLAAVAAVVCALLRSNCSLCKRLKLPSAPLARSQKS